MNRVSIMGELAASLAHEILHRIADGLRQCACRNALLERSSRNLPEVEEALACIVRDADWAKGIVDRMRDHIKKAPPRSQPFDLNEVIDEVIEMAPERNQQRMGFWSVPPCEGVVCSFTAIVFNCNRSS